MVVPVRLGQVTWQRLAGVPMLAGPGEVGVHDPVVLDAKHSGERRHVEEVTTGGHAEIIAGC
jgi:hypothetical protein